ncbi:MAG TPA: PBP1A family penicillin-binding protein, partial [Candidatus Binataceae bacterium]|nr:PBP1A family penicillin-binding protein [Candidatus Binataceae bacterium]
RNLVGAMLLLIIFATGFYLAQLYSDISAMIEQRREALTSAIYSAPATIRPGDDIVRTGLLDRLNHLSYTQAAVPASPGEYARAPGLITIYTRSFTLAGADYPGAIVRVALDGVRVTNVIDSFGVSGHSAALEPEVIGRLLPGAPAERVEVPLGEMPPYLVNGLIATEDRWFYYHPGIDPIRVIEAAFVDVRSHHLAQGASTLTQQLARTFMDRHERSFSRKFRELAVALVLEMRLGKREILERYINDVPMGSYDGTPIEGLSQAARYLFNKDLREVTPAEAATLVGMIQAPSLYDPRRHPENCLVRRNIVLGVMKDAGVIDAAAYQRALAQPIDVTKPPGLRRAPYFTDYVTSFVDKIPGLGGHLEGLKVYTTLDPEMQAFGQDAIEQNLAQLEKSHSRLRRADKTRQLESAMVALDAGSGAIRAMVGGRDYSVSQFNRAAMAQRQPGSAFKPIVYLTAIDPARAPFSPAMTLATVLPDRPMTFGTWTPANYERTYQGQVTVAQALFESLNVPTAWVGNQLGPARIAQTAHELGIQEELPAVLPISIGADETTLLELAGAYQVFANAGAQDPPYAVAAVVDAAGHVIFRHNDDENRVINPSVAYLITGALEQVLRYGTGASARKMGLKFPAAGKTGTTQDYHDGYFIGYTPDLVCGVWVGFDEPQSLGLPGATVALPAWVNFMTHAVADDSPDFAEPSGIEMATIDPQSGGLATSACPRAIALPFLVGTAPTTPCGGGGILASLPAILGGTPNPRTGAATAPGAGQPIPGARPSPGGIRGFFHRLFH